MILHPVGHHQWYNARRIVAGLTARVIAAAVGIQRELSDLSFAVAVQAEFVPFHRMQDGRHGHRGVTSLTEIIGPPRLQLAMTEPTEPVQALPGHPKNAACYVARQCYIQG